MLFFTSCNKNVPNPKRPSNLREDRKNLYYEAKYSHLENKLYMLTERLESLERVVKSLETNSNSQKEIPKTKTYTKKHIISKLPKELKYYKLALRKYKAKQYQDARELFIKFLESRTNILSDDAKYWLAMIKVKEHKNTQAKEMFKEILNSYPVTNKAPKILYNLAKLEKNKKAKQNIYIDLLKKYPRAPETKKLARELGYATD